MLSPQIKDSVKQSVLCWLATSDTEGQPNVSPKEIFVSWGEDRILIANVASPQSAKNINVNEKVCVSFVDILVQKGFQVKGTARVVKKSDPLFDDYAKSLIELAGPDFPFATLFEVVVSSVKPITAPRYRIFPDTTEQQQIASAKKQYGLDHQD